MVPILAGLTLCWIWLCWKGLRFVREYDEMLARALEGYSSDCFPYNHRAFLTLGIIGFGAVYSPRDLALTMTRVLFKSYSIRRVFFRQIDQTFR
jgi:hypothetical protein